MLPVFVPLGIKLVPVTVPAAGFQLASLSVDSSHVYVGLVPPVAALDSVIATGVVP